MELGDRAGEGHACENLGRTYSFLRKYQQALNYQYQALSIAKEVGDRAGEGRAYGILGFSYGSLSKYQQAINYQYQDLSIAKEVGDRVGEGYAYGRLGSIYGSLGKYQQAINYHKKALSIAREVGDRVGESQAYGNLGTSYHLLDGDFEQAMKYFKQQLSVAKEAGDRAQTGYAYSNLATVSRSLGDSEQAIEYPNHTLSIAKDVGDRDLEGVAYRYLGNVYNSLNEFQLAREYSRQYLSISEELGDKFQEGDAYYKVGVSLANLGCWNEALFHFITSVEILDAVRASCISEDVLKISFRSLYKNAYTLLWRVLIKLQLTDEALFTAKKGRAQALVDALKVNYGLTSLSLKSNESEDELTIILKNISVSTVFLAVDKETINMWVLRKERKAIFKQEELKVDGVHKDYFAVLLENTLKNIRAGVDVKCENRSLDKRRDNPTSSTEKYDQTSDDSSHKTIDCFKPLYDATIGSIEDLLDGDDLIVVPDGALSLAPWAALSEPLRIRTVPSLTSLKFIVDSPVEYHCKSGALLVGDPCLKKVTNKWGNPVYDELTYAKKEVEMIGEILKCEPLTGEAATKQEVLGRIGSFALVHIAAHGSKETGAITLAPHPCWESTNSEEEEYLLKISDVQAVKLRARLVVLSCCHSGQGEVSSEGVVGIARAFLFAGARSVVASLWAIDDEATMEFMKSFYQHLRGGESTSTALQRAMKCLRDSDNFSAPKHWAPSVLIGDDVTIEFD